MPNVCSRLTQHKLAVSRDNATTPWIHNSAKANDQPNFHSFYIEHTNGEKHKKLRSFLHTKSLILVPWWAVDYAKILILGGAISFLNHPSREESAKTCFLNREDLWLNVWSVLSIPRFVRWPHVWVIHVYDMMLNVFWCLFYTSSILSTCLASFETSGFKTLSYKNLTKCGGKSEFS